VTFSSPISSREEPVWNYQVIARDFVVNLEPMPRDVKTEALAYLVEFLRHKVELEVLEKLKLQDHPLAKEARAAMVAARAKITFHNNAFL
jgi:hypothetical protein